MRAGCPSPSARSRAYGKAATTAAIRSATAGKTPIAQVGRRRQSQPERRLPTPAAMSRVQSTAAIA
jgi:hypothetical protein